MNMPDGQVAHAEVRIGGAILMLHDESPEWRGVQPQTVGDTYRQHHAVRGRRRCGS
jgi:uncharacterized glyoxalase superfamily protein PhnB